MNSGDRVILKNRDNVEYNVLAVTTDGLYAVIDVAGRPTAYKIEDLEIVRFGNPIIVTFNVAGIDSELSFFLPIEHDGYIKEGWELEDKVKDFIYNLVGLPSHIEIKIKVYSSERKLFSEVTK